LNAPKIIVENCLFAFNSYAGLQFNGTLNNPSSGYQIRGNTFIYNGGRGLGGYAANGSLVEKNYVAYNNTERFKISWDSAGAKFARTWHLVVQDNVFDANLSKGFWCDFACYNLKFVRNTAKGNAGAGFYYELSQNAIVASNLVYNNVIGINATQSGDLAVWNNTMANNGANLVIDSYSAVDPITGATGDATAPGIVRNNVVRNNIFAGAGRQLNGEYAMFYTYDKGGTKTANEMISQLNHDAYYRPTASFPRCLITWGSGLCYETIAAYRAATKKELNGFEVVGGPNPFFVGESVGDYQLSQNSRAKDAGTPLPTNIAQAIGVQPGVPVDLGALKWASNLLPQKPSAPGRLSIVMSQE
jgi:hypothetical protein